MAPAWFHLINKWRSIGGYGLSINTLAHLSGSTPDILLLELKDNPQVTFSFCTVINAPVIAAGTGFYNTDSANWRDMGVKTRMSEFLAQWPYPEHWGLAQNHGLGQYTGLDPTKEVTLLNYLGDRRAHGMRVPL